MTRKPVSASNMRASSGLRGHRVTCDVDGSPLWFESEDVDLRPVPEAFGSALLLPALHRKRRLALDAPVSTTWLANVERLLAVWHGWWGYPAWLPDVRARPDAVSPSAPDTALCFSGGVDSFYSLLHGERRPDLLVTLHGFDVPLEDDLRMAAVDSSLRIVAAEVGARPVVIRTNFREHPAAGRPALWERSHGGVLAATGHLLSHRAHRLTVSASYGPRNPQPWGSSLQTDAFWSSDQLSLVHYGADVSRDDKLRVLAHEPLVRRHLRVCWENRTSSGNCSRCGKCLVTMLALAECGVLGDFPVFEDEAVLAERLGALPYLKVYILIADLIARRGRVDPDIAEATRKLVKRSWRVAKARTYLNRLRGGRY